MERFQKAGAQEDIVAAAPLEQDLESGDDEIDVESRELTPSPTEGPERDIEGKACEFLDGELYYTHSCINPWLGRPCTAALLFPL